MLIPAARTTVRGGLVGLSLAMVLSSLGTSVASVALPTLASAFTASFHAVQWVVLAYLLAITTLIVSAGRLGDLVGRRRVLLAGIAVFTAASVVCGIAPTLGLLIAARAVQGVGAAIMMALTIALVGEAVPKARTGAAMGLLGTVSAIGTALGPSLGGVLIGGPGWRAIFLVNVPLGMAALVVVHRYLRADPPAPPTRARLDVTGTLVLVATLAACALAMTIGHGRFGLVNLALLGAAGLGAVGFVRAEARAKSPLIPLAMVRQPILRAGLVMSGLVATVMMTTLVVGPFYLGHGLGLDTAVVGLTMSAGPVVSAVTGVPAGRAVDRLGAQRMTVIGLLVLVTGCVLLAMLPPATGVAGYLAALVVTTVGYALFQAANNTAVMSEVLRDQRGVVSGLLNLSRNLGLITGASVMAAMFAFASATSAVTTTRPDAIATGTRITFATAALLGLVALVCMRRRRR